MSDHILKDDLDYLRDLAEAGQTAPLLGGRFLTLWGVLATLAYSGHYLVVSGQAGLPLQALGGIWGAFALIGLGGQAVLAMAMPRHKPGAGSAGNRLQPVVWMAAGASIFSLFFGLLVSQLVGEHRLSPDASLPLVFAVYALALITTGKLAGNVIFITAGWVALAFVGLTAALYGEPVLYLAGALGAALTVLVPGLVSLIKEPRSVV